MNANRDLNPVILQDTDDKHLHAGGTMTERSHSFMEDIMEGIPDPANDPLL